MAETVWLNNAYVPKLAAVGLGTLLDTTRARVVTPARWWAPERLATPEMDLTRATDMWAYGITLLELYSGGEQPFRDYVDDAVVTKFVLHQRGTPERHADCPPGDWACFRGCFAFRPEDRASALGVLAEFERLAKATAAT